ncbi:hypothetical protein GCM10025858_26180 [Alicyclobacillus sacchari]|uniref:sugar ABC transporter ATP-binding protein n=1 Tax=Alicyclobacillus sacchari TaxID=392010 RepID=UPI0023E9602A|nr:sugar ABC transporter ATP-binding protein [Alicyclobacillus sacchari]GMA58115.1 hypothetical protein GCM10025858_26180 [Alicyclobacillus sacchari]
MPEVVSATGLMKSFSGVTVVKGIDISLNAGEAHALVGENGAGKSTVIKVLSGVHQPDSGVIKFDGREVTIANPAHAHQLGIFTVHQEPALMPELSVAENVFMGFHPHRHIGPIRWVRMSEMNARCEAVFQRLGIQMDVRESAARLTIAEQQMVEIAKSLIHDVKVLILDEPTATLSLHETQTLFSIVKRLMSQGTAVLFVSHRLHEVFELCSRVTVMRDGQMVAQRLTSELTDEQLVNLMVGRKVDLSLSRPYIRQASSPLLKVRSFNKPPYFQDVNFEIFSGEIVGLAGLIGAGRTNVAEALFGIAPRIAERCI